MTLKRRFTGVAAGASLLLVGATASFADNLDYTNDNGFTIVAGETVAQETAAPSEEDAAAQAEAQATIMQVQQQLQTVYEVASIVFQAAYVELTSEELTEMIWNAIPEDHIRQAGGDPAIAPSSPAELFNAALPAIYMTQILNNNIDPQDYTARLLNTFLGNLDAHSGYHPPANFEDVQEMSNGAFGGLGVSMNINTQDGYFEILGFADMVGGAPAENAGIQIGDRVTHVDGVSIRDLEGDALSDALRGQPGSDVQLTIEREGEAAPLTVTVTRGVITQNPVVSRTLEDGRIGYMRLSSFTGQSERAIIEAVEELEAAGTPPEAYILDLRFNPGGRVDQATGIVDSFLEDGEILSAQYRQGRTAPVVAQPGDILNGRPLIILVNSTSASASEIVSGVLQHHDRAIVIGTTSFGKGSMQTIIPLRSTQGAGLRLTTALYLIANSHSIQNQGVTPDITVDFGAAALIESERRNEADLETTIDNTITPTAVDNSDHMQCVANGDVDDILNDVEDILVFQNRMTGERYLDSTLLCAIEQALGLEENTRRIPQATQTAPATAPTIAPAPRP
jgi:carboxyl-terminal processing protease